MGQNMRNILRHETSQPRPASLFLYHPASPRRGFKERRQPSKAAVLLSRYDSCVLPAQDSHDATEFIVTTLAAEANREGSPLSEIEEKIMYFSETAWTLSNMDAISARFDAEYDQVSYEERIAELIRRYQIRIRSENPDEAAHWEKAVKAVQKEDRYLLVLLRIADGSLSSKPETGSRQFLKLLAIGLGLGMIVLTVFMAILYYMHP